MVNNSNQKIHKIKYKSYELHKSECFCLAHLCGPQDLHKHVLQLLLNPFQKITKVMFSFLREIKKVLSDTNASEMPE